MIKTVCIVLMPCLIAYPCFAMPVPSTSTEQEPVVPAGSGGLEKNFGTYCIIGFSVYIGIMAFVSWDSDELGESIALVLFGTALVVYTLRPMCRSSSPLTPSLDKGRKETYDDSDSFLDLEEIEE
jgi:hypothetical protein